MTTISANISTSATLIDRIRKNDQLAWHEFVEIYAPLVYRWSRKAKLPDETLSDVSQEVFRVVHAKLETFDAERKQTAPFRSWLWGITRLVVLDFIRIQARQPTPPGGTQAHEQLYNEALVESSEMDEEEQDETRRIVFRKAAEIMQNEFEYTTWQAFWRAVIESQPTDMIASELGITRQAVRQAKYRVLRRLRNKLGSDAS